MSTLQKVIENAPLYLKMAAWHDSGFDDDIIEITAAPKSKKPKANSSKISRPVLSSKQNSKTDLFLTKYSPLNVQQVAGNKAKVQDLRSWLADNIKSGSDGKLLLVSGPSGCGKTAAVTSICRELKINLQEWMNPHDDFTPREERGDNSIEYRSQLQLFDRFLMKCGRHKGLDIFNEDIERRGILVEELPNAFITRHSDFHRKLRDYRRNGKILLIIIFNTSGDWSIRKLFPDSLISELHIKHYEFNPIPKTDLKKVLLHISTEERLTTQIDPSYLATLCETCNGDIRYAINHLQFNFSVGGKNVLTRSQTRKQPIRRRGQVKTSTKSQSEDTHLTNTTLTNKDDTLLIFRGLGRVLYNKREETIPHIEERLPLHLSQHKRRQLQFDPENVFEQCKISDNYYTLSLHQNLPSFMTNVDNVSRTLDYLCVSDELSDWSNNTRSCPISVSIAMRGILHSSTNEKKPGWMPLKKPDWYAAERHIRNIKEELSWNHITPYHSNTSLVTDVIPQLHRLWSRDKLVRLIPSFRDRSVTRSIIKGERFDDKDNNIDEREYSLNKTVTMTGCHIEGEDNSHIDDDDFVIEECD